MPDNQKVVQKDFFQRHVKTAIRKASNWGDFLNRLEQISQVYQTDLSVRTEIEELPPLPEFPTAARISEFVVQLEEVMGRMNPSSHGPAEPHLWLVGKIPTRTWENCRETSKWKSRTHSYDDLVDLLIEWAMEGENDSHLDKYLRNHLPRETPVERSPGGRSPQPHSNPRKGRGGQLKHMTEGPPSKGKRVPNLFDCRPTDDKDGRCHAPDSDGQTACMLPLKRTQKTKDGQEVKHQDHFRCTITCGCWGNRRHYEDKFHRKRRGSKKLKKAEEERRNKAGKDGRPGGGGGTLTLAVLRVRVTLMEDEGPQPHPLVQEEHPTPLIRVSRPVKNRQPPPLPALVAPTKAARTPRSAASIRILSACRPLGWKSSFPKRDRGAAPRMRISFFRSP